MGRDGDLGKALACGRHGDRCALSGDIMAMDIVWPPGDTRRGEDIDD